MSIDVFISYRGADRVLARRLESRLRSRWGSRVFRDETSLMPGHSWSEQLLEAMKQANVMLALIGPGWHIRKTGEDWVRDELLGAIEAGNPVLPVLVGDPDKLKSRLADLPEAFQKQAVVVSGDLAGFDLHKVEQALRSLGAFGERLTGGLSRQLSETLPHKCAELIQELLGGRSLVLSGPSGSGRSAMLLRISDAVSRQGDLVAASGINLRSRSRRTHSVIASWIDGLCELLETRAPEQRAALGSALVNAVLEFGPDLLAREVLRPALLLPLGDDDSDQKILDAARRPSDQWAPFPPERLVSQSLSVIQDFVAKSSLALTLIVDNVESIDGSSKDLIRRMLRSPHKDVHLVLATSAVRENAKPETAKTCVARELSVDQNIFRNFRSLSLQDDSVWGEPGAVIHVWLKSHNVQLLEGISEKFVNSNPYYALSALWYLVDNGHLIQQVQTRTATEERVRSPDGELVTWIPSRADKPLVVPGRNRLLDHMIEEFVPIRFRTIIEAGSLIGRRFLYSAAFAAAHPPQSIDRQPPGTEAIRRWSEKADEYWQQLSQVDPDGSVIVCHLSADDERMISLAQADLVTHLGNKINDAQKLECHIRLAQYFRHPIAADSSTTLDDNYRNAQAAAAHWASANAPRDAADAERIAAEFAERALAYPEARRHYQRSIRLFTQLLANKKVRSSFKLVDHEDLLILANCLYRLGQMTRLANERKANSDSVLRPEMYFNHALKRLSELSINLHDKHLAAPVSEQQIEYTHRDLPEPNLIRHHIRLCETLSGRVKLELAQWYCQSDPEHSKRLLFDALRHAESARGEADSRWLLAAASAQLAEKLVEDALAAQQSGNSIRSHNLAIEAQFQIERVIGLAAVSPDEDRNLEEPRSLAWTVLGQLFQTIELEQQLAGYAFSQMNNHRHEVSDLVDMMTDRRLGLFLLSTHLGQVDEHSSQARGLLVRHKRWAIESGIAYEHSGAYISLALLELVEQSQQLPPQLGNAREHIDQAIKCASDARQRQDAYLLKGFVHAVDQTEHAGVKFRDAVVLESFRLAELEGICSASDDEYILSAGWRTVLIRLLRWCPQVEDWVGINRCLQQPSLRDDTGWACHRFFSALVKANDGELRKALERANTYLDSAKGDSLMPASDTMIWRLLKSRVPTECFKHALRTRKTARELLKRYCDSWAGDDVRIALDGRDIDYAIAVHEWYRSTDPSRLLTLAQESNMQIDGHEWASPKLLSGRLAIQVLDRQYGAAEEIGQQRLRQIDSMVTNWAQGSKEAGPLEQIFYIALQMQEPRRSKMETGWRIMSNTPKPLAEVYLLSLQERENLVRQAGLNLVQDFHLIDVEADAHVGTLQDEDDDLHEERPSVEDIDIKAPVRTCQEKTVTI
ncbi:MAG: toll/interleukin-1 receptor domain-containing protein [Granulosicoccus sp.]